MATSKEVYMGKYKRLGVNTLLIFIGNMGSKLIGLIMLPLYTRWLGPELYGVSDVLNTYATVLLSIVTCSIAEALFVFPKDKSVIEKTSYFSSGILFTLVMSFLTALVFLIIDFYVDGHNSFLDNIWLLYVLLITQILQTVLQQFIRSIDEIKVYSITGFIVTVATAILGCIMIPSNGLSGYIWSISLANIVGSLYSLFFSGAYKYLGFTRIDIVRLKEMLTYSVPLVPSAVTWWVIGAINRPIMEKHLGLHDIGLFAVASKFPNLLNSLFVIFGLSWQISVLEEYGKSGYSNFFNNTSRAVFAIIAIGAVIMTAFSKQFIYIFASKEFYDAWTLIPLLTIATLLGNLGSMFGTNFLATKKSKYMLYTSIWASGVALLLNFIFIPLLGLQGAAISTFGSMFVLAISRIYYSRNYVEISNISEYILILVILLLYIEAYKAMDNIIVVLFLALIAIITICLLERKLIKALLMSNKMISNVINKVINKVRK